MKEGFENGCERRERLEKDFPYAKKRHFPEELEQLESLSQKDE
jgi:hypothetical protein